MCEVSMRENLSTPVPKALETWFIVHFVVDMLFGIPLMAAPEWMLTLVGWQTVDPFTARLAAAALFGIGIESFLGRGSGAAVYRGMLRLKIMWSAAAVFGVGLSLLQGAQEAPWFAWGILVIFMLFNFVWLYWHRRLSGV